MEIAGLPSRIKNHAAYSRNAPADADVYNFPSAFNKPVTREDTNFDDFTPIAEAIKGKDIPIIAATGDHYETIPRFPAALPLFFPGLRGKIFAVIADMG